MAQEILGDALANYLYGQSDAILAIEEQIENLPANGSAAFAETRPEAIVTVLLAAHDEPPEIIGNLLPLLGKRTADRYMPPTSVIVSCNAPEGAQDEPLYTQNLTTIADFAESQSASSGLAVSYFEVIYPPGTVQGKRRKDLGDVAMLHAWRTYSVRHDFPGVMSHMMIDADTPDIRKDSLAKLHHRVLNGERVVAPRMRHQQNQAFPNLSRTLGSCDEIYALLPSSAWDGYIMFDMQSLARGGGYAGDIAQSEVHETVKRCLDQENPPIFIEDAAVFTTDARRLHAKFLEGVTSQHRCWPSFSTTEEYRTNRPDRDLSQDQMRQIIMNEIASIATSGLPIMVRHYVTERGFTPSTAYRYSVKEFAACLTRINKRYNLDLKETPVYVAVQEAARKYRIV